MPSRSSTIQFRVVEDVVFKVFSQNRIQLRRLFSRSLTFQFAVEILQVFAQDRFQQLHPHLLTARMRRFKVFFFRTFPRFQKSAQPAVSSSTRVHRHSSSSTVGFHQIGSDDEPTHHGCRITDFVYKMLVLASRTPKPMQYLGAVLRRAGVVVGRLRRQDDMEEALAVRRRRWRGAGGGGGAGRGGRRLC